MWDRFTNVLVAYTPSNVSEVDFSEFNLALGISGGQLETTTPDMHIDLYDENGSLLVSNTFPGTVNNGVLSLANPEMVKNWVQNFESDVYSVDVNSEDLTITPTHQTVTVNTTMYSGSQALATASDSYTFQSNCSGCGEWIIE